MKKAKPKGTRVAMTSKSKIVGGEVNIREWGLPDYDDKFTDLLDKLIREAANEAMKLGIEQAVESGELLAGYAGIWSEWKLDETNALLTYVELPFGASDMDLGPHVEVDLTRVIRNALELSTTTDEEGKEVLPSSSKSDRVVRANFSHALRALRTLADEIEAALRKPKSQPNTERSYGS